MSNDDLKKLIIEIVVGIAVAVIAGLLAWLGRAFLRRFSRLRVIVVEASARYYAPGLRLPRIDQERFGPMVYDDVPAQLIDALKLVVYVRVELKNTSSVTRTLAGARLHIGKHDGDDISCPAYDSEGKRFAKCDVGPHGGYEAVDLRFAFGENDYGKGGYDYSDGATYLLIVSPAVGRARRFQLDVSPALKPDAAATVTARRLRWRQQVRLAETTSRERLQPRRELETKARGDIAQLVESRISSAATLTRQEVAILVDWAFRAVRDGMPLTYPIVGDEGSASLLCAEGWTGSRVCSDGFKATLSRIAELHAEITKDVRGWKVWNRLRESRGS